MKKQDKNAGNAGKATPKKGAKVGNKLTGAGQLKSGDLDQVSGGFAWNGGVGDPKAPPPGSVQ